MQAKIQTLKVKNANNEEFQIYPRTLIQCVTNENGDNFEDTVAAMVNEQVAANDTIQNIINGATIVGNAEKLDGYDSSHFATVEQIAGLSTVASSGSYNDLKDTPSSLPASDVADWAKASAKPTYTKDEVGLANVDNTADANKPVSTAQQAAIDTAKNTATAYTDTKIAELINGAPATLDTLKEIADAMSESKTVVEVLNGAIGTKVDKVDGKGLSTNDYTTAEKDKLAGIAAGAEVNVQSDWNATSGDALILNKPTFLTGGSQTTTSSADGGSNVYTFTKSDGTTSTLTVKNGSKGDKGDKGDTGAAGVNGTNGVTPTIKAAAGSNIATVGTPSVTASTSGTTTTFTFNNLKGEKGDKGDPGVNATTTSAATQSAAGLMSAADKTKLDGIATGANAYSLPNATSSTLGGVKIGSNITVSSGTISLTKANVTAALGYTPPTTDTNTTYSAGTGLALSGTTFSVSYGTAAGTACQGNDSRLSDARTPVAHNQAASTITAGTFAGAVVAPASTAYTTNQIRNAVLTTTDPGAGTSSSYANGSLVFVYE